MHSREDVVALFPKEKDLKATFIGREFKLINKNIKTSCIKC